MLVGLGGKALSINTFGERIHDALKTVCQSSCVSTMYMVSVNADVHTCVGVLVLSNPMIQLFGSGSKYSHIE